jgi:hypothetical protein
MPTGLTVTPEGATGTTAYGYQVTALTAQVYDSNLFDTENVGALILANGETLACAAVQIANGNAALSATNYNQINIAQNTAASGYNVYRSAGAATQGIIVANAAFSAFPFNDTGLTGDGSIVPLEDTTGDEYNRYHVRNGYIKFEDAGLYAVNYVGQITPPASATIAVPVLDVFRPAMGCFMASRFLTKDDPSNQEAMSWMAEFESSLNQALSEYEDGYGSFKPRTVW